MIKQISYQTAYKLINREPYLPVKPTYLYFGYYAENELTCCIGLNIHDKRVKIECYFTDKKFRGKGYGTLLLRGVADMYKNKTIYIDCLDASKNIAMREGFDYKRSKTYKYFTIHRMVKNGTIG